MHDSANQIQPLPNSKNQPLELEIIACSLEDALAAAEGGASRLEVCVRLDQAGLTPPLSLIRQIIQRVSIPVRAMLREHADFVLSGPGELSALRANAREFARLGVDGLVVGHIKDRRLDLETLRAVMDEVPGMRFTVHHAIERTAEPLQALWSLEGMAAVDRALVHGGTGSLEERARRLLRYKEVFGPPRQLIAGGGVTLDKLRPLYEATGIQVFHLGRAVRTPEENSGRVDARKVRQAWAALTGESGHALSP